MGEGNGTNVQGRNFETNEIETRQIFLVKKRGKHCKQKKFRTFFFGKHLEITLHKKNVLGCIIMSL